MKAKRKIRWGWIIVVVVLIPAAVFGYGYWQHLRAEPVAVTRTDLPTMTVADLSQYDGTQADKPIYLAMNGLVYDVTAGKSFYQKGGTYHSLAGKDDTAALRVFGGDIIQRKYPVIARLVQ